MGTVEVNLEPTDIVRTEGTNSVGTFGYCTLGYCTLGRSRARLPDSRPTTTVRRSLVDRVLESSAS